MVFHWSLSDSKSPHVFGTPLSILGDLNNAVIRIVSTRLFISKSSSVFINLLMTVRRASITIGMIVTFMFFSYISSLAKSRHLSFFLVSFHFILWSTGTAIPQFWYFSFFFFDYYKIWLSGWDLVIRLNVKIPVEFVCVILQGGCWVVHIPFVHMFKFKFLSQFPVDHFVHPAVSSLIYFLF